MDVASRAAAGASSSGRPASRAIRRAVTRVSEPPSACTRARGSRSSRRTAGASADSGGSPGRRLSTSPAQRSGWRTNSATSAAARAAIPSSSR